MAWGIGSPGLLPIDAATRAALLAHRPMPERLFFAVSYVWLTVTVTVTGAKLIRNALTEVGAASSGVVARFGQRFGQRLERLTGGDKAGHALRRGDGDRPGAGLF